MKDQLRNEKIPYLASVLGFEDYQLEAVKIPTKREQDFYKNYAKHVLDELYSSDNSGPSALSLPSPAYAVAPVPSPHTVPPSPLTFPPPGGVLPHIVPPPHHQTVAYPYPHSFLVGGSQQYQQNLKSLTTNPASRLEKEFFSEVSNEVGGNEQLSPVPNLSQTDQVKVSRDSETRTIREPQPQPAPNSYDFDRFGYAVRTGGAQQSSSDPAEVYRTLFPAGALDHTSRRRKRTRSKSTSPNRRRTKSKSRGRNTRSRSRGRRARSRSTSRRRGTRSRSRVTRRRSRSRRRSPRRRSRSRSPQKKKDLRQSRSRSKSKPRSKYRGPPVPAFMIHPADRLFSGEVGRSTSVRKRMRIRADGGFDHIDKQKAALDKTLKLIQNMKADKEEVLKEPVIVTMEVEILDDGRHKQFTQIGIGWEDNETGVYNKSQFRAILPTDMAQYDKNLILKNQINLLSSLKFKYDDSNETYQFIHVKKGDVELVSEETALKDLLTTFQKLSKDDAVVLFTLDKATFVPLLIERMERYGLLPEFSKSVKGICDFVSCAGNLRLSGLFKEKEKFGDKEAKWFEKIRETAGGDKNITDYNLNFDKQDVLMFLAAGAGFPMPYAKVSYKVPIPCSKQMRLFAYNEVREFNMPYYKRTYISEKTDLSKNGFVDLLTERIQKIGID